MSIETLGWRFRPVVIRKAKNTIWARSFEYIVVALGLDVGKVSKDVGWCLERKFCKSG